MTKLKENTDLIKAELSVLPGVIPLIDSLPIDSPKEKDAPKVNEGLSKSLTTPKTPYIRQSVALNLFNITRCEGNIPHKGTGIITIENVTETGTLTISIKPPPSTSKSSAKPLRTKLSLHRLFRVLIFKFTTQGSLIINLALREYMQLCGLKDEKEARKQLKEDLALLDRIDLSYTAKHKNNEKAKLLSLEKTALCASPPTIKNSRIIFELTESFYKYLSSAACYPMPIFEWVFKIDIRRYPHAFYLANKILEHHNMNYDEPNAKIISVRTLVEACPSLSKDRKHFTDSIKNPFERSMEYLGNYGIIFKEYCNQLGELLSDRQCDKPTTYDDFMNSLQIKFEINNYPPRAPKKTIRSKKSLCKTIEI